MDWLAIELMTGIQKLLCLGLDRTPASDMIDGTVMTWHEAITTGRSWDQGRDTPRIRSSFVTLAQTVDRWPQPKHFLDALPRVEQSPALTAPREVSDSPELRAVMAGKDPREVLGIPPDQPSPPNPALDAAAREIERLRVGKEAAAGNDR